MQDDVGIIPRGAVYFHGQLNGEMLRFHSVFPVPFNASRGSVRSRDDVGIVPYILAGLRSMCRYRKNTRLVSDMKLPRL